MFTAGEIDKVVEAGVDLGTTPSVFEVAYIVSRARKVQVLDESIDVVVLYSEDGALNGFMVTADVCRGKLRLASRRFEAREIAPEPGKDIGDYILAVLAWAHENGMALKDTFRRFGGQDV